MLAAIYARKSTEQNGVNDEAKSVTRQIEHAKAFAGKHGWTVEDAHVYVDDGISGAEFVKRPGLVRLMNALKPRPPFQVLIMSEESRLGREQIETAYVLKQITDAGVRVFFYLEARERTLDTALDKVMLSLTNFASEMEREKARQRTYDAMVRKARALHVTGGKVYGYDNVEVTGPEGQRLHVVRRINPTQAAVVQRIFDRYATGSGLGKIARTLNAEGVRPPRADGRGWAPTAIREMLYRELYRGVVVWNRSQKTTRGGTKRQRKRPAEQWLRLEAPDLRIVPEPLWQAVHERLAEASAFLPRSGDRGRFLGRPRRVDGETPYLLTGFTRCAACGGAIGGSTQYHGSGPVERRRRVTFYSCTYRRTRGPQICDNDVVIRTEIVDRVLLDAVAGGLDGTVLDEAVDRAIARLEAGHARQDDRRARLEAELAAAESRAARLAEALAKAGPLDALIEQLRAEEERKRTLQTELEAQAARGAAMPVDPGRLRQEVLQRAADIRAVLGRNLPQARQALRKLLPDRITMEPTTVEGRRGYRLSGELYLGGLFRAEVRQALDGVGDDNSHTVVAPTGFEPVFQP